MTSEFYVRLKDEFVLYGVSKGKSYRVYDIKNGDPYERLQFLIYNDMGMFEWVGAGRMRPVYKLESKLDGTGE
jgi:hypothetical protein